MEHKKLRSRETTQGILIGKIQRINYRRYGPFGKILSMNFFWSIIIATNRFNPLNAELNPICHLLALLGGATIVVVSWLRVKVTGQEKMNLRV